MFLTHSIPLYLLLLVAAADGRTAQPKLQRLGGLRAEHGMIAVDGRTLSAFSPLDIYLENPATRRWMPAEKIRDAVSIQCGRREWHRQKGALPVSAGRAFEFCDRLNQIDIGSTNSGVQAALPVGARLKSIAVVSDNLWMAIFSTSADAVRYDVRIALVRADKRGGHSVLQSDTATESGNYCGLLRGPDGLIFLFADEPSGSSDFAAVYAYSITGVAGD